MSAYITRKRVEFTMWSLKRQEAYMDLKLQQTKTLYEDIINSMEKTEKDSATLKRISEKIGNLESKIVQTGKEIRKFLAIGYEQLSRDNSRSNLLKIRSCREIDLFAAEVRQLRKLCRTLRQVMLDARLWLSVQRQYQHNTRAYFPALEEYERSEQYYMEKIKQLWIQ